MIVRRLKVSLWAIFARVVRCSGTDKLFIWSTIQVLKLVYRLKPFLIIDFDPSRIGDFSELDKVLRKLSLLPSAQVPWAFTFGSLVCNETLAHLYSRRIPFVKSKILSRLLHGICGNGSARMFTHGMTPACFHEFAGVFNSTSPQVSFLPHEDEEGRRALVSMGIGEGDWFVCIHCREPDYLLKCYGSRDWGHHDYRDATVHNYLDAARFIVRQGGKAVRMGYHVNGGFPEEVGLIDYASLYRSDFCDVYLPRKCRFFLGSSSGLYNISSIFHVPVALANVIPYGGVPYRSGDLFIPKMLRHEQEEEFLSFQQAEVLGLFLYPGPAHETRFYVERGLELIENSPEEIADLAQDMLDLLGGRLAAPEEREMQRAFKARFLRLLPDQHLAGDIAPSFIRRHKDLFASI